MRLVLCSPCRPHGCVFPAEDVNERRQAIPEDTTTTLYQLRVAHEVKQTRSFGFAGDCAAAERKRANSFEARPRSARELS